MRVEEHRTFMGAAAIAFYSMLAIFPAAIFLLSLLPYFPISDLDRFLNEIFRHALPESAFALLSQTIRELAQEEREGLVSFGGGFTLWAASSGINACILQLNATYGVLGSRSFIRRRMVALGLTLILFGIALTTLFTTFLIDRAHWFFAFAGLLLALGVTYSLAPDVQRKFRLVSFGSLVGAVLIATASFAFKWYVENFGRFHATYGGIGAVIVLMLWLYALGLAILLGSEIDSWRFEAKKAKEES